MTTHCMARHPGAAAWAEAQGVVYDQLVPHIDTVLIQEGDRVIGSLPVNLAAEVCQSGAQYLHLSLKLTPELRGRELSARQLEQLGAQLRPFHVEAL